MKKQAYLFIIFILFGFTVHAQKNYKIDTNDTKKIWKHCIIPIIENKKNKVLSTINFPLEGDWAFMMGLKKEGKDATKNEFLKNYDRFFNDSLKSMLTNLDYNAFDSYESKKGTVYRIAGSRIINGEWEASVVLHYRKIGNEFYMIRINGIGGNFYD